MTAEPRYHIKVTDSGERPMTEAEMLVRLQQVRQDLASHYYAHDDDPDPVAGYETATAELRRELAALTRRLVRAGLRSARPMVTGEQE